jgi:hypothetical protein
MAGNGSRLSTLRGMVMGDIVLACRSYNRHTLFRILVPSLQTAKTSLPERI